MGAKKQIGWYKLRYKINKLWNCGSLMAKKNIEGLKKNTEIREKFGLHKSNSWDLQQKIEEEKEIRGAKEVVDGGLSLQPAA